MNSIPDGKNRRVLVIDDNRSIHDDFRKILCPANAATANLDAAEAAVFGHGTGAAPQIKFEVDSAYQGQEGVLLVEKALQAGPPYALVFVDVRMPPGWDGVETTGKLWERDPNLQVVLCTAYSDYSWEEIFEKLGQRDGLLILKKPFDAIEALQLAQALTEKWWLHQQFQRKMEDLEARVAERTRALQTEVAEHTRAEEGLRLQNAALEAAANSIVITDQSGNILWVNAAFTALTGYAAQEVLGKNPRLLKSGKQDEATYRNLWQTISCGQVWKGELINRRKNGSLYAEEMTITPLRNAEGLITRYIAIKQDITARKRAEEELQASQKKFQDLFTSSRDAIVTSEPPSWRFTSGNPAAVKMFGAKSEEDFISHTPWELSPERQPDGRLSVEKAREMIDKAMREGSCFFEWTHRRIGGQEFPATVLISRMQSAQKVFHQATVRDITEQKRLQAQLFQSQKLETVGRLAGGIAHEFNSIMTAIVGQSELILNDLPSGDPLSKNALEIRHAADRATTLTRQLLAYGRKQIFQPEILDLNHLLANVDGMLRHLMGVSVDVRMTPGVGLKLVKADAGQIEQVIMNMAINARDAMPKGGKLTLETSNVRVNQESVGRHPDLKPGHYVMLAITDTGTGMSDEVRKRAFEPFFTTKPVGEGTGLGLATCYGIVKQSGGHINAYSEPGKGTTFKVYLPQVEQQTKADPDPRPSPKLARGTETILLVEDDSSLREMACALLQRLGYGVLPAANGMNALSLVEQHGKGAIDLLFTDVVMPQMDGQQLSERIRALHPETKILFASAYTENAMAHQRVLDPGVAFLQKPFTPSELAHKLREVLDAGHRGKELPSSQK